jgi:hypothetical protein
MELNFGSFQLDNYTSLVFEAIMQKVKSECGLFIDLNINSAKCTTLEEFHKHIQYLNNFLIENTSFYIQLDQYNGGQMYVLSVYDARKSDYAWS